MKPPLLDPTGRPTTSKIASVPNEMLWCDDDVKALFVGTSYPFGMPTQVQLIVTVQKLVDAITAARKKPE